MRKFIITGILGFVTPALFAQQWQINPLDSKTKARLTIGDFCLCDTKIQDLTALSSDFKEVKVEEMDTPEKCYAHDSRYANGKGIASEKFPGMIFQEGNVSGLIGKIRLTREFKGTLPDGKTIDLGSMKLRDVFTLYPDLKNKWNSRGCSDYWNFSNDTISFYVRINPIIRPQFPVREEDYLDNRIEGVDIVASCSELRVTARHLPKKNEPLYFVDGVRTNRFFLTNNIRAEEIAAIEVLKGDKAVQAEGEEGRNGIVYVFSKDHARTHYWEVLRKASPAYAKAVRSPDDRAVYVMDGEVLKENVESKLFRISAEDVEKIEVINSKQLRKEFNADGEVGVILKMKQKEDLK